MSGTSNSSSNNNNNHTSGSTKKRQRRKIVYRSLVLPTSSDDEGDGDDGDDNGRQESYRRKEEEEKGMVDTISTTMDDPTTADISQLSTSPNNDHHNDLHRQLGHSPHFLAGLHVIAHVMAPLRKALIHFHMSTRNHPIESLTLEWITLRAFGKLFHELVTPPMTSSDGASTRSGITTAVSDANRGGGGGNSSTNSSNNGLDGDPTENGDSDDDDDDDENWPAPVDATHFLDTFVACCRAHGKPTQPSDATEGLQTLLEVIRICSATLPVTARLWVALLDVCGMGLIAKQTLVGRLQSTNGGEIVQRTKKESRILYCPLTVPLTGWGDNSDNDGDGDDGVVIGNGEGKPGSLLEALEKYCSKQPYSNTKYDFDTQPFDFEVRIPSTLFVPNRRNNGDGNNNNNENDDDDDDDQHSEWQVTRSMQFTSLTAYLFLGIQRRRNSSKKDHTEDGNGGGDNDGDNDGDGEGRSSSSKFYHTELMVPSMLDLTKLCAPQPHQPQPHRRQPAVSAAGSATTATNTMGPSSTQTSPPSCLYQLVGGILLDDEGYVAVLRDPDIQDDDNDEAWKLMETEEVIPMSQGDVLEFLKGDGGDDDNNNDNNDDDDDGDGEGGGGGGSGFAPCGTLAVYRRVATTPVPVVDGATPPIGGSTSADEEIMNQLLSDIIISQVSGTLDSRMADYYYYEEEVIEE